MVGDVDLLGGDVVAFAVQPGGDIRHRLFVEIRQEEFAAHGGAAADGDADASGADEDGDFSHEVVPSW
ncbi:hypothetical protein [Microbacterium sp. B35-30]|uniref:hypothetical protein n=1 Tax=Microbacterium sp. B35-30 TaxID=1962642 RepID=UPI001EF8CC2B|nr:hypothetical protein [Microbacterium sp. B35-30]